MSIISDWRVNPAWFLATQATAENLAILRKYGIICSKDHKQVSRITKNRHRIDNTSECKLSVYGTVYDEVLLYILGIGKPWKISRFEAGLYQVAGDFRDLPLRGEIRITLDPGRGPFECPSCGTLCKVHEYESRCYSHPRMMQMATALVARVPKLRCERCGGYPQMPVPWARPNVSYSRMMEREVFTLLQCMPVSEAAELCGLRDGVIWDMVRYRVRQALERMDLSGVTTIYVDETSSKKGHNYITVICDQDRRVVFVCEGKGSDTMDRFNVWLQDHGGDPERIAYVSCDLGDAYPAGVRRNFPNATIVYDHFHAVQLIDEAMDVVARRAVAQAGLKAGIRKKLRMNPDRFTERERKLLESTVHDFEELASDYRLRNVFSFLYKYHDKDTASRVLDLWYQDVQLNGSPEMRVAANSIYVRREGILSWFDNPISNGFAEGMNSLIQTTKRVARGYRNLDNFAYMIYLRNGHLDISFDRCPDVPSRPRAGLPGTPCRGDC